MNSNERNGKLVAKFFLGVGQEAMLIFTEIGYVLILENDYHGDHDMDWIVKRTLAEHREVERFNVRFVSRILWAEERS